MVLVVLVGVVVYLYGRGRGGGPPAPGQPEVEEETSGRCEEVDSLNISSPRIIFGRHQPLSCKFTSYLTNVDVLQGHRKLPLVVISVL